MQRGVFGRMAVAHDDPPIASADAHLITVHDAGVARRHGRHQVGEVVGALADLFLRVRVGQAMACEVIHRGLAARAAAGLVAARRPQRRHHEVGHRHPEPGVPALAQPIGQADVVRVHVRDQDAQDGQAFKLVLENVFPQRLDLVARDAAVDDGPAVAAVDVVAQQPEVDMIQRERQRHADPFHAFGHRVRPAGLGLEIGPGILQLLFVGVHCLALHA